MTLEGLESGARVHGFLNAVHSREPVAGLTHDFYRYPARFSPLFARESIKLFSDPGDIVLDPFMGGGTTLVEATYQGRRGIGVDISSLAVFLARVKTTPLSEVDIDAIWRWAADLDSQLNLRNSIARPKWWIEKGYQRNINTRETWPTRKALELALDYAAELGQPKQRDFVRCLLLKTGQWALDSRKNLPTVQEFRAQLTVHLEEMIEGAQEFTSRTVSNPSEGNVLCLHRSTVDLESDPELRGLLPPRLILTSPPYPGVHVLYHRWQVHGRRETPAPFWIAGCVDGQGESFYTFGHREETGLKRYFRQMLATFRSLRRLSSKNTLLVQMVGFSNRAWQLPTYLDRMEEAGFVEVKLNELANADDGRLWRAVPNRKWYADQQGSTDSSREVVLFHRPAH